MSPRALHGGDKAHSLASLRFHRSGQAGPDPAPLDDSPALPAHNIGLCRAAGCRNLTAGPHAGCPPRPSQLPAPRRPTLRDTSALQRVPSSHLPLQQPPKHKTLSPVPSGTHALHHKPLHRMSSSSFPFHTRESMVNTESLEAGITSGDCSARG